MNKLSKVLVYLLAAFSLESKVALASTPNQTDATSPITSGSSLPYRVVIEQANFQLPVGLQSGAVGVFQGLWVFIAGRMNGLHGFGGDPFPADQQNISVYVVNPTTGTVVSRDLTDPSSGLTPAQIETLTVTSPEFYQDGNTLYLAGGYGVNTQSGLFETKPVLTAIYLPGIVQWVTDPNNSSYSVVKNISQISDPTFQVAGGEMFKSGDITQLVFGQNFSGVYTPGSNGVYTDQVRQFHIKSINGQLAVDIHSPNPQVPNANYRRRDLNILPTLLHNNNHLQYGLTAFSGVFTDAGGVWTVPVIIDKDGNSTMADPTLSTTFKQGMNNYACATISLYSRRNENMYHTFFGGISYGFFSGGTFQTDTEIPFINQVTTVQMDKNGNFTQYLMANEYPVIISTQANPGNQLLFGAGAYFVPNNIPHYPNGVINLDAIRSPIVVGYIVGGIQSTLPNTNTQSDSAASPYIFKVTLIPQ